MTKKTHYVCPECGGDIVVGKCQLCGWLEPWRADHEARRRAAVKKAHGPHRRRSKEEIESPFVATPTNGYTCPVCNGRGWLTNACNSCYLCLGRGRVSGWTLLQVKKG